MSQSIDPRYAIYRASGEWLAQNTPLDATVGALEVGIIGYFAQRWMIDFAGLIQPRVAEQFANDKTYQDAAIWAVGEYQPDFVLIPSKSFPRLQDSYLKPSCKIAHRFDGIEYNFTSDILIFNCR